MPAGGSQGTAGGKSQANVRGQLKQQENMQQLGFNGVILPFISSSTQHMPTSVNGAKVPGKPFTNHKLQFLNMENSIKCSQETINSRRFMLTANLSRNMARNGAFFKTLTSGK